MPTLDIPSVGRVEVGDDFLKKTPEQQDKDIDEIASAGRARGVAADIRGGKQPEKDYSAMSAGQLASEAYSNILPSAERFAGDIYQTVRHPIQAGENLAALGKGVMQKLGVISGKDATQYADAVGRALLDRYGSKDAILKTLVTDPVGIMADVSTVLSAGGSLAARAPGLVSRVGEAAATAGKYTNPLTVPLAAAGTVTKGAGKLAAGGLGVTTGVGGEAIKTAAQAGAKGGETGAALLEAMANPQEAGGQIVAAAKDAVSNLRQQRGEIYRKDMANIRESAKVLDFDKIDEAVSRVQNIKNFKGIDTQRSTAAMRGKITEVVNEWKQLDPREFHTAEGLDALKQTVGDLRDDADFGKPSRAVADDVYHAIRQTIVDEFPKYGEIMKGYEEASNQIKEIERTLSVNPKASIDTSLRKITSALRDNVNTNYGKRKELVGYLARNGATHLLEKIAGQALSAAAPRGFGRVIGGGEGMVALSALALGNPAVAAKLGLTLAATSPRAVGTAAYGAGAATRLPLRGAGLGSRLLGQLPPLSGQ